MKAAFRGWASGEKVPTINLDNLDPECAGVDIVGKTARQMKIRAAMKNSFGFGGTNSTVIYKAFAD